jgi:hypothetical protein
MCGSGTTLFLVVEAAVKNSFTVFWCHAFKNTRTDLIWKDFMSP